MDLISQFEQRRGKVNQPTAAPPVKDNKPGELDARQVLALAFDGRLERSSLIPVLPPYQAIFGKAIWICPDEDQALNKQREVETLAFAPGELMDVVEMPVEKIAGLVAAKRSFGGTVTR